jgi:hypothetical protein
LAEAEVRVADLLTADPLPAVEPIQEISAADREGWAPIPTDPALEAEAEGAAAV